MVALVDADPALAGDDGAGLPGDRRATASRRCGRDGVEHAFVGLGGTGDATAAAGRRRAPARRGLRACPPIVHRSATVARSARLAEGAQVLAGAVVGADAALGRDALVNAGAIVGHDATVGEGAHVASGARLGAMARRGWPGRRSSVPAPTSGTGAVVLQGRAGRRRAR